MKKLKKNYNHYFWPICLILILSFSRLIPHPWNFTPVLATSIFAGFYFKEFFLSFFIVIFSMFLGDIFLGFHSTMIFTYISLIIAVLIGLFIKVLSFKNILLSGLVGSICFFIITNFGVWLVTGMYDQSIEGLLTCYVAAIPFFSNTILSTLFYLFLIKFLEKSLFKKIKIA